MLNSILSHLEMAREGLRIALPIVWGGSLIFSAVIKSIESSYPFILSTIILGVLSTILTWFFVFGTVSIAWVF